VSDDAVVLDPACGSRMFWFDREDDRAIYGDIRTESHILCDGRALEIKPDLEMDFRDMPFPDNRFALVVFDPPHIENFGPNSWMAKKYGRLSAGWRDDLRQGFAECFRVLRPEGVLIFKWNDTRFPVSQVLALTPERPLFGNRCGKSNKTHWVTFMKPTTKPTARAVKGD
jgi:SAM-dependent methyltransferase